MGQPYSARGLEGIARLRTCFSQPGTLSLRLTWAPCTRISGRPKNPHISSRPPPRTRSIPEAQETTACALRSAPEELKIEICARSGGTGELSNDAELRFPLFSRAKSRRRAGGVEKVSNLLNDDGRAVCDFTESIARSKVMDPVSDCPSLAFQSPIQIKRYGFELYKIQRRIIPTCFYGRAAVILLEV